MLKLTTSLVLVLASLQLSSVAFAQTPQKKAASTPGAAPTGAQAPAAAKPAPAAQPQTGAQVPVAPVNWATAPATTAAPAGSPTTQPTASASASPNAAPAAEAPTPALETNQRQLLVMQRSPLPVVVTETPPPDVKEQPKTYEHRFTITVDLANVLWRTNRGYDLFSRTNASWRIGIGAGYDLAKLPNDLIAAVEVGGLFEPVQGSVSDSGLVGNTLTGELSAATLLVGGSLRWAPLPWLAPYGRLQLLTSRYSVDINSSNNASGNDWSYHKGAFGGTLGAGVMLNLPPRSPVNGGLLLEGGYWLQESIDLVLENGGTPAGNIATYGATLGSLGNSGPYFRLAGMLRF